MVATECPGDGQVFLHLHVGGENMATLIMDRDDCDLFGDLLREAWRESAEDES